MIIRAKTTQTLEQLAEIKKLSDQLDIDDLLLVSDQVLSHLQEITDAPTDLDALEEQSRRVAANLHEIAELLEREEVVQAIQRLTEQR